MEKRKTQSCRDSRPCFARKNGHCTALTDTYPEDGDCPFCKEKNPWAMEESEDDG